MLDKPAPVIRRARRQEIPEIADLTASALECFRGSVPDKVLGLYIDYSCDVAGRWAAVMSWLPKAAGGSLEPSPIPTATRQIARCRRRGRRSAR